MYPGNHTDSEILYAPRYLKTRPGAPRTHLAYITDDEAGMLQQYKPGTPHEGAAGIPNYDTWGIDTTTGAVTGGSTADGGGAWSGDVGGTQTEPEPWSGSGNNNIGVNDINTVTNEPIVVDEINAFSTKPEHLSNIDDKVWKLATQAYLSNPGYELSFEGKEYAKQLAKAGITKGSPEYQKNMIQAFGMPQVTSNINQVQKIDPMDEKYKLSFKGQELMKKNIMPGSQEWYDAFVPELQLSGQGKYLMGQYDEPGSYEDKVAQYYADREAEQAQQTGGGQQGYGYGYDPGSYTVSGGYGYGGDPNEMGKTPFYGDPYSEARFAPLEQHKRMVDVNSPLYAARGGIMNLRR